MWGQQAFDFARLGKPTGGFLRIYELAVDDDLEDTVFAFDQLGGDPEFCCDIVRQTGGARLVVSNDAVFDRDHESPPAADHISGSDRRGVGSKRMREEAKR